MRSFEIVNVQSEKKQEGKVVGNFCGKIMFYLQGKYSAGEEVV